MATATVARPTQTIRTRRDAPRTSTAKRASIMLGSSGMNGETASKRRKMDEPFVRTSEYILKKHRGKPVSLTVHLHANSWRFEDQEGSFAYESPMRFVLEYIRRQEVPHDMIEDLHANSVPFYDGCLIVEVHNHRTAAGKDKSRPEAVSYGDGEKFSMHNYHSYITPSPHVPYPSKATIEDSGKDEQATASAGVDQAGNEKQNDGPRVTTVVLHPTQQSRHAELLLLTKTPITDLKSKKRGTDAQTPASAQPPTPQSTLPPTPSTVGRTLPGSGQKMCLDESNFYQFQADLLVATEPPLYLEPANDPITTQKVLDMLTHPLHSAPPPSPKTRKRTHAEVAFEDAQNAEYERRMLIMDERIKPSLRSGVGANASDTQGTAASLGFSRFKTIQMVKEKVEENERLKKEKEAEVAVARKQQEEANQAAQAAQAREKAMHEEQQRQKLMAERQRQAAATRKMQAQQQQAQTQAALQQAHAAQQQQQQQQQQVQQMAAAQNAALQHGNMMHKTQANFQHPTSMAQASPVVRHQTPMVNSSPMMAQNGFAMVPTSSQGAGSPPRPTSAAMPNHNMAMARQASQQHASANNTPHMAQGTPHMAGQAMSNRQMSQTPRMQHGSPAPGTPGGMNMGQMPMQTPQNANMTPAQMAMLHAQSGMAAASPGQQNPGQVNPLRPDQISNIGNNEARRMMILQHQQQQQRMNANPQMLHIARQQQLLRQQQTVMQQRAMNGGMQNNTGQPGMQATPQMGHTHPGQQQQQQNGMGMNGLNMNGMNMNGVSQQQQGGQQQQLDPVQQQQRIAAQTMAMQQVKQLVAQYGNSLANVPQQAVQQLPPNARAVFTLQVQRAQQQRMAQQMALQRQQQQQQLQQLQQDGGQMATNGGANPAYLHNLQQQRAQLAGMQFAGQQQQQQQQQQNVDLQKQFAAMQNALNQQNQQQGGGMQ